MQTQYQNPAIKKAFQELKKLSADEETRRRAEIRERALKDEISLLAEAREEGREEGLFSGLLKGIELLLNSKFGEAGMPLAQEAADLHDVNALQETLDALVQAETLEQVKDVVQGKKKSLHN